MKLMQELLEARIPEGDYNEKLVKGAVDKVILTLEGKAGSGVSTLLRKYKKVSVLLEKLSAMQKEMNADVRAKVAGLFDATDKVYTRVINTSSMTVTLAKEIDGPTEKNEIDWEAVARDISALVSDELQPQIEEILAKHTSIKKIAKREPALRVNPLEEGLKETFAEIKNMLVGFGKSVTDWCRNYDRKLAAIQKKMK